MTAKQGTVAFVLVKAPKVLDCKSLKNLFFYFFPISYPHIDYGL